jgi:riboflavin synthase
MFSGIVEEAASVADFKVHGGGADLIVQSGLDHAQTRVGDSIAIDGVCLTVVKIGQNLLSFNVALETLRKSNLAALKIGGKVNLERSLKVGDRISGHFVFGHVDTKVKLLSKKTEGNSTRLLFEINPEFVGYIAPKGSVAISGVSLTVGEVQGCSFSVYMVPHTSAITTIGSLEPEMEANFEVDMLARYVRAALGSQAGVNNLSISFLKEHGYVG